MARAKSTSYRRTKKKNSVHQKVEAPAKPGSRAWMQQISGSKIAAIMGVSRWETPYSLWHKMNNNVKPEDDSYTFRVGHAMERALAELYLMERNALGDYNWRLSVGEVQYTRTDLPFPNTATIDRQASCGRRYRVLEFKTFRSSEKWGDPTGTKLPVDYHMQVNWNMGITGFTKTPAHLMAMGPFFETFLYEIEFDEQLFNHQVEMAAAFYGSLELGIEPPCEGKVADLTVLKKLHPDIHGGEVVEVDSDLARRFMDSQKALKVAKQEADVAKTLLLEKMGKAEIAQVDGSDFAKRYQVRNSVAVKALG